MVKPKLVDNDPPKVIDRYSTLRESVTADTLADATHEVARLLATHDYYRQRLEITSGSERELLTL